MINKSHLHNVGTLSSWPHALGTLDWLMKLIKVNFNYFYLISFIFHKFLTKVRLIILFADKFKLCKQL